MLYSKLFGKTLRQPPTDAETASHKYLASGGFIDQLVSGVYSLLPLGYLVTRRIENIIREEMLSLGSQEVFLPTLQPKSLWEKTGRWEDIDPPLFIVSDRHDKELALGPTHEEVITDLASRFIKSYRDLPVSVFQIQNKFRNEMRSTGGLLRVREFMMKDLYSFHPTEEDLGEFYDEVAQAYLRIFNRCGLEVKSAQALGGTIGGNETHEFMCLAKTGEDKVLFCVSCGWAASVEKAGEVEKCPECGQKVKCEPCIENGHIFKLGTKYSQALGAFFTDADGRKSPIWMGCYGIGLGRLMATIVEANHDDKGIIWPSEVSPFSGHLIVLPSKEGGDVSGVAEAVYQELTGRGLGILYDDRKDVSAGVKLTDADLIGIPLRFIVSPRSVSRGGLEISYRGEGEGRIVPVGEVFEALNNEYVDTRRKSRV